jgi:hypothetical protein
VGIFVTFLDISFIDVWFHWTCQLKNIEGVFLTSSTVISEGGYADINWDRPTPGCCEPFHITQYSVLGRVQAGEDILDHIVVSPCVPAFGLAQGRQISFIRYLKVRYSTLFACTINICIGSYSQIAMDLKRNNKNVPTCLSWSCRLEFPGNHLYA